MIRHRRYQTRFAAPLVVLVALLLLAPPRQTIAGTASPHGFREVQPDGTPTPTLYIHGDHLYNYMTDADDYTVVRDEGGWYAYAVLDDGDDGGEGEGGQDGGARDEERKQRQQQKLKPSSLRVGRVNPTKRGLTRRTLPSEEELIRLRRCNDADADEACDGTGPEEEEERQLESGAAATAGSGDARSDETRRTAARIQGNVQNLVVLIKFSDYKRSDGSGRNRRTLPSPADISVLMKSRTPHETLAPTGSVASTYQEYSYGKVNIQSTVTQWIKVDQTEEGSSSRSALKRALIQALDTLQIEYGIDARTYQSVLFLHSAYGAEFGATDCLGTPSSQRVWAHSGSLKWRNVEMKYGASSALWGNCGSDVARIGMICHEIGHALFRLPDLYDKSPDQRGIGVGAFDLMAYAWGKDNTQLYPPHPSAWTKIRLGWLEPTVLTHAGDYTLLPVQTIPQVYRIDAGYPKNEYLLLENRQAIGTDRALGVGGGGGGGGLAVYHIDDDAPGQSKPGFFSDKSQWPYDGNHYQVAMVQADRRFDLEVGGNVGQIEDLWPEGSFFGPGGSNVMNHNRFPNTDSYQNGDVKQTGIRIFDIKQQSGKEISFRLSGWYLLDNDETSSDNVEAPPVESKNNNRDHDKGDNENGEPNVKGCRDERSYRYTTTYGDKYGCDYARTYKHVCRRRDKNSGKSFWEHCKASCRDYFMNLSRTPFDICAK